MSWNEVSSGRYERPLGENEKFIKLIGDRAHPLGREHWSVTSQAKFRENSAIPDDELISKCKDAWCSLRFEHPSIASRVEGSTIIYEAPNEESLKAWVNETFLVQPENQDINDCLASLKPARYVTAHLLLSERSVVLHFPHWRTDGYGALMLQNAFNKHLAAVLATKGNSASEIIWGDESSRLVPSIEDLLQLPEEATPEIAEASKAYLATVALMKGSVGLSPSEDVGPETLPRGTRSVRTSFTEQQTSSIEIACQERKINITAAVQASCAAATRSGAVDGSDNKPYTGTIRLSLRPVMPAPWDGEALAAGICTGGYMAQTPASNSWLQTAEYYNSLYEKGVTDDFVQSRREYARMVWDFQTKAPAGPPPVFSEIDISGVDDVEDLVQASHSVNGERVLEVLDISVGVETLSRQMYCFLWTFRGRLELMLVYNEAFYSEARAARLLHRLQNVLKKELKIT